jgi:hypothetical protein
MAKASFLEKWGAKQKPNNVMNADSRKRSSFVMLRLAAGYGEC